MRFIKVLLCFAIAATAYLPGFAAADEDAEPRTVIYVNAGATPGGNGSWRFPFRNLPPALDKARATSDAVTIRMGPGRYVIDSTLVIDRPLILRGASELLKGPEELPTGGVVAGTATRIVASASLGAEPLFSVGRDDGVVISGVTIRNLVLTHADPTATEMTIRRVQDYEVSGNVFRTGGRFGLESIASSGQVIGNHFSRLQTGAILAAGYPDSPSTVLFKGNRSVDNDLGGVLLDGASVFIPEHGDHLSAVVRDNDLARNGAFAVRLFVIFRLPGLPGDTQETGNIHAFLKGNRIRDNVAGVVIDAGFPFREVDGNCYARDFSGSINLRAEDNTLTGNVDANLWVLLTRWPGIREPDFFAAWDYLHATRIEIRDPQQNFGQVYDGTSGEIFYDNPERDPHIGPCPGDEADELLGNVLRYNGERLIDTNY